MTNNPEDDMHEDDYGSFSHEDENVFGDDDPDTMVALGVQVFYKTVFVHILFV